MPTERFHLAGAEILVGADVDETVRIAAGQFAALARKIACQGSSVHAALSGGNTPRAAVSIARRRALCRACSMAAHIHFFWADERNVPPGDPESNYSHGSPVASFARSRSAGQHPSHPHRRRHRHRGRRSLPANLARNSASDKRTATPRLRPAGPGRQRTHGLAVSPPPNACTNSQRLVVADHVEEVNSWRVTLTAPRPEQRRSTDLPGHRRGQGLVVRQVIDGRARPGSHCRRNSSPPAMDALTWILDSAAAGRLVRARVQATRRRGWEMRHSGGALGIWTRLTAET